MFDLDFLTDVLASPPGTPWYAVSWVKHWADPLGAMSPGGCSLGWGRVDRDLLDLDGPRKRSLGLLPSSS